MKFGGFEALKNINLEVHEGELVVLLGANGAGKSTIFNTISGLNKITLPYLHTDVFQYIQRAKTFRYVFQLDHDAGFVV